MFKHRQTLTGAAPPFVWAHEQIATSRPKVVEFTITPLKRSLRGRHAAGQLGTSTGFRRIFL